MRKQLGRYGAGIVVTGALAGVATFAVPPQEPAWQQKPAIGQESARRQEPAWQPITQGLGASPERLLAPAVTPTRPARVVSTSLDRDGRPVVTVRTATDRDAAAMLVVEAQRAPGAISVEMDAPVSAAEADPLLPEQWDLARLRVDGAWARSTGAGVTVAVIDSGVDASHPDLAGQVLPGADFITGTEGTAVDPHGHGTHVAGTIAALTGNGMGVAGTAPDARILPVRVLGANGSGYMSDVANGVAYAADHGADVINLSVSATTQVGAVSNAVAYARSKGVVVVAAAGNGRRSGSPTSFPAADEGVIAVAATTSDDSVAAYSNRGGYVDVAAPGSDILSTYPGNRYGRMSGTSMAAPHVAAAAALLRGAGHRLTPDQVEQALTASAVDLGEPGRDGDFGAGRIDAAAALATLTPPSTGLTTTRPTMPGTSGPAETTTPTETTAPTQATTTEPAAPPTAPTPAAPRTPEPSTPPSPEPNVSPTPGASQVTPGPSRPAPSTQAAVQVFRTGPGQLIVVTAGADGEPVQIQRWTGAVWETVRTFPAAKISRFGGLTPGLRHRAVVSGATSSVILL